MIMTHIQVCKLQWCSDKVQRQQITTACFRSEIFHVSEVIQDSPSYLMYSERSESRRGQHGLPCLLVPAPLSRVCGPDAVRSVAPGIDVSKHI